MSGLTCAVNGVYSVICRDPETAAGGLDPFDPLLHAPGFYRHEREDLEFLTGTAIDRKVQVVPVGLQGWIPLANPVLGFDMRAFHVVVRVGYFVGDHATESFEVMVDDDSQIIDALIRASNWPTCSSSCINGVIPLESNRVRVDHTRFIWEITVEIRVTG